MRRRAGLSWLGVFCLSIIGLASGADSTRTLKGTYEWDGGPGGELEAAFTPVGEGKWEVAFRFRFDGEAHVYSGTAEGSLSAGALKGAVKTENKKGSFTFAGEFRDGTFSGTHTEVTSEGEHPTGALTLKE